MNENRDLTNTPFYKVLVYITDFLFANLCFLLVISPVILYVFGFNKDSSIEALFLISILLGPALTTLFSVMGKLINNKEISPIRDFFHFYKLNFLQGILVSITLNIATIISYIDMNYFKSTGNKFASSIFLIIIVLSVLLGLYIYPLISRYNIKLLDAFKISIKLMFSKLYLSLTCVAIVVIALFIIQKASIALLGILLGSSMTTYLIMLIENKMIINLEKEIKNKYK